MNCIISIYRKEIDYWFSKPKEEKKITNSFFLFFQEKHVPHNSSLDNEIGKDIEIYNFILIKQRKSYKFIKKLGTIIYHIRLLSKNEFNSLYIHNEFNIILKLVGSHLARPKW